MMASLVALGVPKDAVIAVAPVDSRGDPLRRAVPAAQRRTRPGPAGQAGPRRAAAAGACSLTRGTLPVSISRIVPEAPKSMVAVARGPTPSVGTTVPRPYLSWLTRSP